MSLLDTLAAGLKEGWNVASLKATVIIFPFFPHFGFFFCFVFGTVPRPLLFYSEHAVWL